eukprot:CAMPEP_0183294360 /NCGR_PEP_ID=MMETSP0160_2-20130417/2736_1 /TAXON_ID=2839 ORGANISM="Odontella Sinensis, Strain Grunow 1884" /NCGR_SAMPLE_ID=MMETSP0160_2 /ASSEMBLY_ACC=CAM_ASM_000250 /LENGTH=190 /DNA_ID=CAMNT_0025455675 /DNA_START=197 /DNA_END=769 /DNA_ORIENTATION=+
MDSSGGSGRYSQRTIAPSRSSGAIEAQEPEADPRFKDENTSLHKKTVSFCEVQTREYPRTLGDHPDAAAGPPITLCWEFLPLLPVSVVEYETHRGPRLTQTQMRMHPEFRRRMLRSSKGMGADGDGFTDKEIEAAERECARAAKWRRATAALQQISTLTEGFESLKRKIKRGKWRSGESRWWEDGQMTDK